MFPVNPLLKKMPKVLLLTFKNIVLIAPFPNPSTDLFAYLSKSSRVGKGFMPPLKVLSVTPSLEEKINVLRFLREIGSKTSVVNLPSIQHLLRAVQQP